MKIKIISACYHGGKYCGVGDVVDVSDPAAYECIALNRAVAYAEEELQESIEQTPVQETRSGRKKGRKQE